MKPINHFYQETPSEISYTNASGPVRYKLTNDYLFRAVLQKNNYVLKGLISSLLHLSSEEILTVEITNPINLGASIDAKDFYLDINVLLNDYTQINLEMQVINYGNWPERSLSYLCRSFDSLNAGQDYQEAKPVIHICFLDFTLFPDFPEFYSKYMLMNVKNHTIYSDKFVLSVVNLTQIELAAKEDRDNQLDYWASLFKATTWEEIQMLASTNSYFAEAAQTMYQLSADEEIRLQCQAREDFERLQRSNRHAYEKVVSELTQKQTELEETQTELEKKQTELKEKQTELAEIQMKLTEEKGKSANLYKENIALQEELTRLREEMDNHC